MSSGQRTAQHKIIFPHGRSRQAFDAVSRELFNEDMLLLFERALRYAGVRGRGIRPGELSEFRRAYGVERIMSRSEKRAIEQKKSARILLAHTLAILPEWMRKTAASAAGVKNRM